MYLGRKVFVLIPALDEEEAIAQVVRGLPTWVDETVVVDNGSKDRTALEAARAGASVVCEPRRGYGAACQAGLEYLAPGASDVVVFMSGDGSDDPEEMDRLLRPIISGAGDLVLGSRALGRTEPGAMSPAQRAGTRLFTLLVNLLTGSAYTDLGPFRAVTGRALSALSMRDRGFGWTVEMQAKAALSGLKVVEVPVTARRRRAGRSKISRTLKGALLAAAGMALGLARSSAVRKGCRELAEEGVSR